jgi:nicotinamide-nucleotide amidase
VHFAAAARDGQLHAHEARYGEVGRTQVRRLSVLQALAMLTEFAERM